MNPKPFLLPLGGLVICLVFLAACGGGGVSNDPILALSADEALAQGKDLLAQEKYARARPYLIHAFEIEPNSLNGREALLLAADTYFLQGGDSNFIQSEAKYRDFLNRFPTSDRAAYAQFQIGNSLASRMERPDRDQTAARQALETLQALLRLYPTSEYAAEAREKIREVRNNLAEHEYMVGVFYLKFRIPRAAWGRLEGLLDEYPDYYEKDKVLYHLGLAYSRGFRFVEAEAVFERLRRQYPDSPYMKDLAKIEAAVAQGVAKERADAAATQESSSPGDAGDPSAGASQ